MPLTASLSGQPRCDGQALLLPLTSQTSPDRLDVRLFADGRYRVDAALKLGELPYFGRFEGSF